MSRITRKIPLLLFWLAALFPAAAEEPDWQVGIAALSGFELSAERRPLLESLPQSLLERLSTVDTHRISPEEVAGRWQREREEELLKLEERLTALRQERDELFFKPGAADQKGLEAEIEAVYGRIAALTKKESGAAEQSAAGGAEGGAEVLGVGFHSRNREGELLPPPLTDLSDYCRREGLDLLIYGTLTEAGDFLLLEMNAFDANRGRNVLSREELFRGEESGAVLDDMERGLKGILIGFEWGRLRVKAPEGVLIYHDGTLLGTGAVVKEYLEPGTYRLSIRSPFYRDEERTLELLPGGSEEIIFTPEAVESLSCRLESEPAGADVYLSSRWIGKTPLTVLHPGKEAQILIQKQGYHHRQYHLTPGETRLSFLLTPEALDRQAILELKRKAFYSSLAGFLLSIPVTGVLYSLAEQYNIGYIESGYERSMMQKAQLAYIGYLLSLSVNINSALHTVGAGVDYVGYADRLAE